MTSLPCSTTPADSIPRSEYPRPQFVRSQWLCLNGEWAFAFDPGDSGESRGFVTHALPERIQVPFCPESPLSGHAATDFLNAVWYRRTVDVPAAWGAQRVLLNFQAVDYDATVWVNGQQVGAHSGGFTPFSIELPKSIGGGSTFTLVVRARDDHRELKPMGKQSREYDNTGCHYTRTTGIWQTVWLEPVSPTRLRRPRIQPIVESNAFLLTCPLERPRAGLRLAAVLSDDRGHVVSCEVTTGASLAPTLWLSIPPDRVRLWQPGRPHLYDLAFTLTDTDGTTLDHVASYAGLRGIAIDGTRVLINREFVFQRLVLDQGYYASGIMTAPDDAMLARDIELAVAAGFNGARLHQKIFEERFLYHADRLGFLVWAELPDWPPIGYFRTPDARKRDTTHHVAQWLELIERDFSHPSIIGWCPLNETAWDSTALTAELRDATLALFLATKQADPSRPVIDASGFGHTVPATDIFDVHDYEQDPAKLRAAFERGPDFAGVQGKDARTPNIPYGGQPLFLSEFGGARWPLLEPDDRASSWGYGEAPTSSEAFLARFADLCRVAREVPGMTGYCYTQLTDVFQEQNGLYTFDRRPKFDPARYRAAQAVTLSAPDKEKESSLFSAGRFPVAVSSGAV